MVRLLQIRARFILNPGKESKSVWFGYDVDCHVYYGFLTFTEDGLWMK